jgi:hypothetical protein
MGILYADARHLLERRKGRLGGRAITLGRLCTFFHPGDLKKLRKLAPVDHAADKWFKSYEWGQFADNFFRDVLKFDSLDSMDVSDYEGATIVHDLSEPVPQMYVGRFDLAMDGGTLEHVFNFPQAMANLMKLAKLGGDVYMVGPCNNLCGHGFYQFSPELIHRVFSGSNGFEPLFVRIAKAKYLSVELTTNHAVYDVHDPDIVCRRVTLITSSPVLIMAMAKRVSDVEPFKQKMLQSDYVAKWRGKQSSSRLRKLKQTVREKMPTWLMNRVLGFDYRRKASLSYKKHFRSV